MALSYLCLAAATLSGMAIPWLIKEVIDRGLARGEVGFLYLAAGAVVAATAFKGVFSYGQGYLTEYISQQVAYDLRNALYNHLQRLSFAYHDRAQTGQLMSRATGDVEGVRMFTSMGLQQAVSTSLLLLIIGAILFSLHWRLALVSLAVLPLLILRALTLGRILRPLFMAVQQQSGVLTTVLQEDLSGMRVVKAFAQEDQEIARFTVENRRLRELHLRPIRVWTFNFPLLGFLISLATALLLWYGGREVLAGRLSVGTLVAFNGYLLMLAWPVRILGWVVNVIARAISAGERIFEVLDARSEVQERPAARELGRVQGVVRFENVSFAYDATVPTLRDVSLEARPGDVIALVGATGSGKSTIINLIPRFYDVTGGRVTLDDEDLRGVTLASLRRQIGIVMQESFLFSATIRDNIAFGAPGASEEAIVAAAQAAGADHFIRSFPDAYDTWVGERGITLSGGQKQRVAIARALLLDPPVLILDDSTSSVDAETEAQIQAALAGLMQGRTTFVIAQRLSTVKNATEILVLEEGEIVERGTHADLLAGGGFYRRLYDLQFRQQEAELLVGGST